eukprot:865016-Prorocentrum_minimum.AAC.2
MNRIITLENAEQQYIILLSVTTTNNGLSMDRTRKGECGMTRDGNAQAVGGDKWAGRGSADTVMQMR